MDGKFPKVGCQYRLQSIRAARGYTIDKPTRFQLYQVNRMASTHRGYCPQDRMYKQTRLIFTCTLLHKQTIASNAGAVAITAML